MPGNQCIVWKKSCKNTQKSMMQGLKLVVYKLKVFNENAEYVAKCIFYYSQRIRKHQQQKYYFVETWLF